MDAEKKTFVCPHNPDVDCEEAVCDRCGWYPPVEQARKESLRGTKLYKIPFTGYCEVFARSPEEATEKAEEIRNQFFAHYDYGDPVCMTKEDEDELD